MKLLYIFLFRKISAFYEYHVADKLPIGGQPIGECANVVISELEELICNRFPDCHITSCTIGMLCGKKLTKINYYVF